MINRMVRRAWATKWISIVVWRLVNGRWFVFRGVPDVIVRMFGIAGASYDGRDRFISKAISEAKAERLVRMQSRKTTGGN